MNSTILGILLIAAFFCFYSILCFLIGKEIGERIATLEKKSEKTESIPKAERVEAYEIPPDYNRFYGL